MCTVGRAEYMVESGEWVNDKVSVELEGNDGGPV